MKANRFQWYRLSNPSHKYLLNSFLLDYDFCIRHNYTARAKTHCRQRRWLLLKQGGPQQQLTKKSGKRCVHGAILNQTYSYIQKLHFWQRFISLHHVLM